jgi:general secretion pathway protein J
MVARRPNRGFTLVELLVALFAMALLAVMSWRGLDGMTRAQERTQARSDEMLTLQVALAQWAADLDALVQLPQATALEWNGRVLRMTRRETATGTEGVLVVGWTQRAVDGVPTWLRWQSPPLATRGDLEQAWLQADVWSQNPGDEQKAHEVAVVPLEDWQIFFFRGDAWTNPLSSAAMAPTSTVPGVAGANIAVIPDGVRLILNLPPGQAIAGRLTRDWVRPTLAGGRS